MPNMFRGEDSFSNHMATSLSDAQERTSSKPQSSAESRRDMASSTASDMPISKARFGEWASAIESDIIPRLLMACRGEDQSNANESYDVWLPDPKDIERLTRIILAGDIDAAEMMLDRMRDNGARIETLCLGIFAPCARRLGDLWEDDDADFAQVTMAMGSLTYLLRSLLHGHPDAPSGMTRTRRALMITAPNEQHIFGSTMVCELFRIAGWYVRNALGWSRQELVDQVANDHFIIAGFSASGDQELEWIKKTIKSLRRHSSNGSLYIMVGGALFLEKPAMVKYVGADVMASNGKQATLLAETMVRPRLAQ
ncbi:hypothetical protein JCM17846_19040 [Iodidimonas nitroreducens]|uniref:B12-binding domain-containing protein n=1 Tax=Iodidimonas nitroreducens TaxID=1236968 RepID=A0A5A7N7C0_9PROT|nr:cobalamin B12-binding domain-containing protein [Iodidimonas nitroreducens]GAK32650.1 putative 20.5 kDa protein in bchF-crtJ intergenic region [alpha proteobacterium Q-1]GER04222.1 hypothetical protein JCM17846_19040 [Iodidimonas nitroreducens]